MSNAHTAEKPKAVKTDVSILSKVNKSREWKAAKRARSIENREYRAQLHQDKVNGSATNASIAQGKIDQISLRGAQTKNKKN